MFNMKRPVYYDSLRRLSQQMKRGRTVYAFDEVIGERVRFYFDVNEVFVFVFCLSYGEDDKRFDGVLMLPEFAASKRFGYFTLDSLSYLHYFGHSSNVDDNGQDSFDTLIEKVFRRPFEEDETVELVFQGRFVDWIHENR